MRIQDKPQSLRFSSVKRVVRSKWPAGWLKGSARPGDLLLLDGPWGQVGGLLCLTRTGRFTALTPKQAFEGEWFDWPEAGIDFKLRLLGGEVEIQLKKEPEGS